MCLISSNSQKSSGQTDLTTENCTPCGHVHGVTMCIQLYKYMQILNNLFVPCEYRIQVMYAHQLPPFVLAIIYTIYTCAPCTGIGTGMHKNRNRYAHVRNVVHVYQHHLCIPVPVTKNVHVSKTWPHPTFKKLL